ncbi:MAG: hypothetical protein HC929_24635 [Leptolyngbyaceae cyanobacterium SM2_5_2]|nr:hypothetical protein [Leptolyngbyaceae cyanobacterium SM2_5_2]
MWQPLRNWISSVSTYGLLSPDLQTRVQVNRWLRSRPCLSQDEWFRQCWAVSGEPDRCTKPLIDFIYECLTAHSGLAVGCIRPSDRLLDDLQFPAVCWFDWSLTLCDEFYTTFGLDITDQFDETQLITCADLVRFLRQQLEANHA